ncbi:MAG: FAD:protein FMN transferase [Firmicutes bacterium]|nr:FAD:protein FMN transferase [Bacillota bacterium]
MQYLRFFIFYAAKRRRNVLCLLLVLLVLSLSGCTHNAAPAPFSETRLLLDTVCTVTVYDEADKEWLKAVLDLCARYEALFSRTIEGSDIWRINNAKGAPVVVEEKTAELLQAGLDFSAFSGGFFDITVGRLCALWDFGGNPSVPAAENLAEALATVDYRQVSISGTTVQLANDKTWLDVGGIAKGYIADQLAHFLKENGVKRALIDLGGNIVTVGRKPDGRPWHIGVEQPFSEHSELIGSLNVAEASVVTSGIYERQFIENNILYHHILDPVNGMPAESDVISATIISKSSAIGDALSTIVILVGSENAIPLLENNSDLQGAIFMLKSGELLQYGKVDFSSALDY